MRELNITRRRDAHSFFRIGGHLLRMDIDRARLRFEDLILPSTDLGAPLLSVHVKHAPRLFGINEHRARVPAVFDGQVVQLTQDAR